MFFALWPERTMQMWSCLRLCNIKKNKFTYSHYLFVTEAPWYYACRREVSILGRGPFPCHPGQKTLPYIELSNGGVDPNVWQGGTRHKSGASDIELLFCQSWNSKIRNILCNIMHENFFFFSHNLLFSSGIFSYFVCSIWNVNSQWAEQESNKNKHFKPHKMSYYNGVC